MSRSTLQRRARWTGQGLLVLCLIVGLARCDWTGMSVEEPSLVVEAFLETGQPAPPVTLRRTRALSASREEADAAVGAEVSLELDGRTIPYEAADGEEGRYVPTEQREALVAAGDEWTLRARWRDRMARAQGRAPAAIEIDELCVTAPDTAVRAVQVDSLRRDSLDIPADQGYLYPIDVTVQWTPPTDAPEDANWVRSQLRPDASPFPSQVVEFFLEPVDVRREEAFSMEEGRREWKGVYAVPVDSSTAALPSHDLTASLVRGDTAFASFAQTRTDPDRREPISNVEGALGVALSVSVDSITQVVPDSLPGEKRRACVRDP